MIDQWRTAHFWLGLAAVAIPGALMVGLIPHGTHWEQGAQLMDMIFVYLGVRSAAKWQPTIKLDDSEVLK